MRQDRARNQRKKKQREKEQITNTPSVMMMIAFITFKSSLVPLFEGL